MRDYSPPSRRDLKQVRHSVRACTCTDHRGKLLIACARGKKYLCLTVVLIPVFFSCATTGEKANEFLLRYVKQAPPPSHLSICYSHGCNSTAEVRLGTEEWDTVGQLFTATSSDAAEGRRYILIAVGSFETVVGGLTGTSTDLGGSFAGTVRGYQMNDVDETVNTAPIS